MNIVIVLFHGLSVDVPILNDMYRCKHVGNITMLVYFREVYRCSRVVVMNLKIVECSLE